MWFLFGFITLISFSVYFGIRRYENHWKGQSQNDGQISFEYRFDLNKDETQSFKVGVVAPREFDFSFKRESSIDRFCKNLGLSVEHQIGDEEFDDLVYVVSNDHHFLQDVVSDPRVIEFVSKLFNSVKYDCEISEIRCAGGRLTAVVQVGDGSKAKLERAKLERFASFIAEWLLQVAKQLKVKRPPTIGTDRDHFILRASVLLALSTGLLVNGTVHGLRLLWDDGAFTFDTRQLWILALIGGLILVAGLVLAVFSLLGRSARTHLVLIEILIAGSLGATLTVFTEMREWNMEMDKSKVQIFSTEVVAKSVSRARKSGSSYYLTVDDWNNAGYTQKIKVTRDFYSATQEGQKIVIKQHEGALGIRWVRSYER